MLCHVFNIMIYWGKVAVSVRIYSVESGSKGSVEASARLRWQSGLLY